MKTETIKKLDKSEEIKPVILVNNPGHFEGLETGDRISMMMLEGMVLKNTERELSILTRPAYGGIMKVDYEVGMGISGLKIFDLKSTYYPKTSLNFWRYNKILKKYKQ